MAVNVPMPSLPGEALLKGLDSGSGMFAKIMNAKYNNSIHPSGDVANAMYVEQLKNQYGENDPRYLEAKRAHEMGLSARQSLMDYRSVLNQTAGIRATSPLGKLIQEGKGAGAIDILNRGANGQGNQPSVSPTATNGTPSGARYKVGEQYYNDQGEPVYDNNPRTKEEREAYERSINKATGDADARNTYLRAQNLDKTRQSINPKDLTRYSGKPFDYAKELMTMAVGGQPSEDYIAHSKAVNAASLMADQMRQFYKDSIQPSAMDRLRELSNPSKWYKNQNVAIAQWEQLNKILDQETETYKKAGTSPIKLNKIEFENGQFKLAGKQTPAQADKTQEEEHDTNADDILLQQYVPELQKISPNYTADNIKHTAKEMKMSIGQVIDQLMAKGK